MIQIPIQLISCQISCEIIQNLFFDFKFLFYNGFEMVSNNKTVFLVIYWW